MRTIYEIGPTGLYTGRSQDIADDAGWSPGWTPDAPPAAGAGQVAAWTGAGWVLAAAPEPAPAADPAAAAAQALEDARAAKRAELDAYNAAKSSTPFSWDFTGCPGQHDDGTQYADVGVQTLQLATDKDQSNWTAAGAGAGFSVLSGQGAQVSGRGLKCSANIWIQAPASVAFQALVTGDGTHESMMGRQERYLARYGVLKRAIEAAADQAALDAIDITSGWD